MNWSWELFLISWTKSSFTFFDDVAQLIEQEFVVSSSVQALLHVAVEFVHHTLHIWVLVLLDTRHTDIATPQLCINTEIEFPKINMLQSVLLLQQLAITQTGRILLNERVSSSCHSQRHSHSSQYYPPPHPYTPLHWCMLPKEATWAPLLWLEFRQALLLSLRFKVWLCKRQTSCLVGPQSRLFLRLKRGWGQDGRESGVLESLPQGKPSILPHPVCTDVWMTHRGVEWPLFFFLCVWSPFTRIRGPAADADTRPPRAVRVSGW